MTRRDFLIVSGTLSRIWEDGVVESPDDFRAIISYFTEAIAAHSPNFDKERFNIACWEWPSPA